MFLSPHISDMLHRVALCEIINLKLNDDVLSKKIMLVKEDMGKLLPPRVLFPAIDVCFDKLLATNKVILIIIRNCNSTSITLHLKC